MEYATVDSLLAAFYRLVGTDASDEALGLHGEAEHDVAYLYLTRGARAAQLTMLAAGYRGWRKRTGPLVWQGSDSQDGGRYIDLPADFLRAWGDEHRSTLEQPSGQPWGHEVLEEDARHRGSGYYWRGEYSQAAGVQAEQLWIQVGAQPPTNLVLVYHYAHPPFKNGNGQVLADDKIDFPLRARGLIPAEAAAIAMEEAWLPQDETQKAAIERALAKAKREAYDFARPSRRARRFRRPPRAGNHW